MCLYVGKGGREKVLARFERSRTGYITVVKQLKIGGDFGARYHRPLTSRYHTQFEWKKGWNYAVRGSTMGGDHLTYDQRARSPIHGQLADAARIDGGAIHAWWDHKAGYAIARGDARSFGRENIMVRCRAYRRDFIDAGGADACFSRVYIPQHEYRRLRRKVARIVEKEIANCRKGLYR